MASTNCCPASLPDLAQDEGFFDSMFPHAGCKRDADDISDDGAPAKSQLKPAQPAAPGHEYHAEHVDPQALCCTHCPDSCCSDCDRPSKRRASAHKVAEFHHPHTEPHPHPHPHPHAHIDTDQQFPDDCFEKFCQECNLDAPCPPDCELACPGESVCTPDDACFDPHCDQGSQPCIDDCADPGCTKISCPEQPCFCQKCELQPCPLGEPSNECHFAHSAPTVTGTVFCYDNAPCHFQEQFPGHTLPLTSYETYPCFSSVHAPMGTVSSAATPLLSPSNYTSLDSAFTSEPSPAPGQTTFNDCFLNISSDHCHIDNSCCHGPSRACGDQPSASQYSLDMWNNSMAQGNGLATNFTNFGLNSNHAISPMSMNGMSSNSTFFNNQFENSMLGYSNNPSWTLPESAFNTIYSSADTVPSKLDFLASAIQSEILNPLNSQCTTPSLGAGPTTNTSSSAGTSTGSQNCVCKWQHAPGLLCLAVFDTPEALHKHTKTAHVDNCTQCFCQWGGCEASSKDFKQRSKLSRHLLGHAGYRPYACSYQGCDKTFATNQAKDNHERTHTGERPYTCDRCGYTTTTHTQLQTHISALHEGKKPHKCRFCDFTCADSSNLSKHERTHQTLRPYRCPHPNCTFKPDCRWENLKRHLRRSGHCPELLAEASEDYKAYRDGVRREIEDWHRRNEDSGAGKMSRRKGRA